MALPCSGEELSEDDGAERMEEELNNGNSADVKVVVRNCRLGRICGYE